MWYCIELGCYFRLRIPLCPHQPRRKTSPDRMFYLASWTKQEMRSLMILQVSSVQVNDILISLFIGRPHSDSTYRQKIQTVNDEIYKMRNEAAEETVVSTFDISSSH